MRVSKTVKNYIEKRVREKFSAISPEEQAYKELQELLSKAQEEANKRIGESSQKIVADINEDYGFEDEFKLRVNESYCQVYRPYNSNTPIVMKAREEENKRKTKIAETIENIIVNLELGGTKEDLERMLKEI